MRLSVPVGIVNKREDIQNPTLITAKAGQAYPKRILLQNWLFEKMNPLVVPVNGVKFKSAFLYTEWAVNILRELLCIWSDWKSFEWIKCLRRHLHQIYGNWTGRNFVTESRVNSRLITHARMPTELNHEIYNYQRFNFRIINRIDLRRYAWPGFTVIRDLTSRFLGGHCVKMFG